MTTNFKEKELGLAESAISSILTMPQAPQWSNGTLALRNITVVGEPGRRYELSISSLDLLDRSLPDVLQALSTGPIEPSLEITLRVCQTGEAYLRSGEC